MCVGFLVGVIKMKKGIKMLRKAFRLRIEKQKSLLLDVYDYVGNPLAFAS